jgi:hypothetical protein
MEQFIEALKKNYIYLFHILIVSSLLFYQTYPLIFYKPELLEEINNEFQYYQFNTYLLFSTIFVIIIYHIAKLRW